MLSLPIAMLNLTIAMLSLSIAMLSLSKHKSDSDFEKPRALFLELVQRTEIRAPLSNYEL
jgi:hypothetical protein